PRTPDAAPRAMPRHVGCRGAADHVHNTAKEVARHRWSKPSSRIATALVWPGPATMTTASTTPSAGVVSRIDRISKTGRAGDVPRALLALAERFDRAPSFR